MCAAAFRNNIIPYDSAAIVDIIAHISNGTYLDIVLLYTKYTNDFTFILIIDYCMDFIHDSTMGNC